MNKTGKTVVITAPNSVKWMSKTFLRHTLTASDYLLWYLVSIVLSVLIRLTASDYLLWYLVSIVLSVLIRLTASDYLLWYLQTFLRPLWNILRAWGDWIFESLIKTYINLCFIMSIYFLLKFLYQARKVSGHAFVC